jgi:hypothetical protein
VDATEIILRLIGAFYAFAGYVVTRWALTSRLLDQALAALTAETPKTIENLQTLWHLSTAVLVFMGGVTLMLLLDAAAWVFLLSTSGQALYLLWLAPRYFDRADPPDSGGRQQTINAFVLYAGATAFVLWAGFTGKLLSWHDVPWPLLAIGAAAIVAHAAYAAWIYAKPLGSPATTACRDDTSEMPLDPARVKRVKVMPEYDAHPLWALDEGMYGDFPPEALGLSAELCHDLNTWAAAYTQSLNGEDPTNSLWSEAQHKSHEENGSALAVRLKRERPDLMVYLFDRDTGVHEVHAS